MDILINVASVFMSIVILSLFGAFVYVSGKVLLPKLFNR